MAEISSYPKIQPKAQDLLLGSRTYVAGVDEFTGNPTSVFTVGAIADLVSAEAGGVNGTVGKIPVFTNTTTVGDSIMTQSSSKIGIGTNSPNYKLDVNGEIAASGDGYLINGYGWANEASSVLTLGDWDGNEFETRIMDENSNEVLRVAGGKVGIGTNTPSQKLHVDGSARVTGGYYDSSNSQGTSGQVLSSTGSGTSWIDGLVLGTTSTTALAGNTNTITTAQVSAIATSVRFDTDNFVSTPPVNKIITLTQAEYNAITTPNVNTLYVII